MLENIFEIILKLSFNATVVALAVILARFALKRAPKKWSYLLWGTVGFRLIFPFSLKSFFSIFSLIKFKQSESVIISETVEMPVINSSSNAFVDLPTIENVQTAVTQPIEQGASLADPAVSADFNFMKVLAIVWLVGFAAMLIYGLVTSIRLKAVLSNSVKHEDNIFLSEKISSPFVFGIFEPKIYIPFGITDNKLEIVIAHELCHISRLDHVIKLLAFLLLCVHWFNPFVWLSFVLMGKDMELSCDEKVLSNGEYDGVEYSRTLLSLATQKRFPSPCPIAFGESGIKTRIKNALKWKRPGKIIAFVAPLVAIIVLAACSLDPADKKSDDIVGEYELWQVEYSSPGIWVDYTEGEYPSFRVNDLMNLQVKNDVNFPSEDWISLVHLESKKITKADLSDIDSSEFGVEDLIINTSRAYYGEWGFSEDYLGFMWLLHQNDGTFRLVMGYTAATVDMQSYGTKNISYVFSLVDASALKWRYQPALSYTGYSQVVFNTDIDEEFTSIEVETNGGELAIAFDYSEGNRVEQIKGDKLTVEWDKDFIWTPHPAGSEKPDDNADLNFKIKNNKKVISEGTIKISALPEDDGLLDATYVFVLEEEGLNLRLRGENNGAWITLTDKTETVLESTETLATTEAPVIVDPSTTTELPVTSEPPETSTEPPETTSQTRPPETEETTRKPYNPFNFEEPFSTENISERIQKLFFDSEYFSTVYVSLQGTYSARSSHPVYRSIANILRSYKSEWNEISFSSDFESAEYITFEFDERTKTRLCFYNVGDGVMEVADDNGNKIYYVAEINYTEPITLWELARYDFLNIEKARENEIVYFGQTPEEAMIDYASSKTFEPSMNLSPWNSQRITDYAVHSFENLTISDDENTIIFEITYYLKPEKIDEFMYGGSAIKFGSEWGEWADWIKYYTSVAMRRIDGTDNWIVLERGHDLLLEYIIDKYPS